MSINIQIPELQEQEPTCVLLELAGKPLGVYLFEDKHKDFYFVVKRQDGVIWNRSLDNALFGPKQEPLQPFQLIAKFIRNVDVLGCDSAPPAPVAVDICIIPELKTFGVYLLKAATGTHFAVRSSRDGIHASYDIESVLYQGDEIKVTPGNWWGVFIRQLDVTIK